MPQPTDRDWMRAGYAWFLEDHPVEEWRTTFVPEFWEQLFEIFTAE